MVRNSRSLIGLIKILFLILTFSITVSAEENKIINPSFESIAGKRVVGWETYNNSTPSIDTTKKHSGTYSIRLTNNRGNRAGWEGKVISLNNAKTLKFTGWSQAQNVSSRSLYALDFKIVFSDGSVKWYYQDTQFKRGTHGWEKIEIIKTFDKEVAFVRPYLLLYGGTGSVWFDDIGVEALDGKEDSIKPVITLIGNARVEILKDTVYRDAGAMAMDNKDGDITVEIDVDNSVKTSIAGTYTVTYTVFDTSGNEATATRTVVVKNPDVIIKPEFMDITSQLVMSKYGMKALVADGKANDTDNLNAIADNKDITSWYIPKGKIVRLCRVKVPSHVEKIWGKGTIRAYTVPFDGEEYLQHGALEIFENPKTKLEITGLTFDAIGKRRAKKNYGLISIFQNNAVHNIEIDNCTFKESSNLNGIKVFADTSKGAIHRNFKIHHNEFYKIGGFFAIELVNLGVDGSGDSYPHLDVNNNYIHNVNSPDEGSQNPKGAISIMRSRGETSRIYDNLIVDVTTGIEAAECQGTLIYNNKLLNIRGQAIVSSGNLNPSNTRNIKIHNNHIEVTSLGLVYSYGGTQSEFYDNYVKGVVSIAIQTDGNSFGQVYRNTIVNQYGHSMWSRVIDVNGDAQQIVNGSIRDNLIYSDIDNGSGILLNNVSEGVEVLSNKIFLKDSNGVCLMAEKATQSGNSCAKNYRGNVPNSREGAGLSVSEHEVGVQQ